MEAQPATNLLFIILILETPQKTNVSSVQQFDTISTSCDIDQCRVGCWMCRVFDTTKTVSHFVPTPLDALVLYPPSPPFTLRPFFGKCFNWIKLHASETLCQHVSVVVR